MPTVLKWLGYIAVHKYSTEIVVANEFHGLKFDCSRDRKLHLDSKINMHDMHCLHFMQIE